MPQRKSNPPVILVFSRDPQLADIRKKVLEKSGFSDIPIMDVEAVKATCEKSAIRMAMIGYSVPPADKRRVANVIKESCKVPVLELHREGGPELVQPTFSHHAHTPDDFVEAVKNILIRSNLSKPEVLHSHHE
jgi:hypothetical protein